MSSLKHGKECYFVNKVPTYLAYKMPQMLTTDRYLCAPSKFFNSRRHALKLYEVTSSAQTLAASCLFVAEWTAVTNTYGVDAKGWRRRKMLTGKGGMRPVFVHSNAHQTSMPIGSFSKPRRPRFSFVIMLTMINKVNDLRVSRDFW